MLSVDSFFIWVKNERAYCLTAANFPPSSARRPYNIYHSTHAKPISVFRFSETPLKAFSKNSVRMGGTHPATYTELRALTNV